MTGIKSKKADLEFEVPNGWKVELVGKAYEICNNLRFPISETERKNIQGEFPYYGPTKVQDFINEYRVEGKYALIGEDGDHFLKWKELPMTLLVEGRFNVNNHAHIIQGEDNLTEWFYYYFQHRELTKYLTRQGAGRYKLTKASLSKISLPIPPLPEQQAIVKVLGKMDKAIQTTERLIAQKELRKKWLMQNLLTGKMRLKGFSGEWRENRLGSIFKHLRDTNDGGNGHSIMTISAKLGLISQQDKFDRVIAGDSLKKYTQIREGDFAYNKGNSKTYPMGCIYRLEEKETALVPFVYICFRPSDKVDGVFYKHWFLAHGLDGQLNKIITSGARGDGLLNVNTEDFFKLKVPYPPKEEQTAIARVLQTADQEISLLKSKADKLREQKKGLMQVLLTGKVRVKNLEIEF